MARTWAFVIVVVSFALVFARMAYDGLVRLPHRRRKWIDNHKSISDAEWIQLLSLPEKHRAISLAMRSGLAKCFRIPAESIAPSAGFSELEKQLTLDGLDTVELIMELEDQLQLSIPDRLAKHLPARGDFGCKTVGDWIDGFLPKWELVKKLLDQEK